ncbi:hypothetical protein RhiirC2_799314 [Rhizophagus irregularis]|uniref:DNase I-like protein n=1 Tax=Rhizophagus irregularis TaxID=588596 RepID=A0A2N1M539_9GLOM|nr:hypothetical protein RhiirC2_799314 [Rhizophagus irregularis]
MSNNRIRNNNNNNKVNLENIDSFLISQRIWYEEQQQIDLDALYLTLHIGTHNINRLAGDNQRNGLFKMPDSFKEQFYIYWSSEQYDKNKGSGKCFILYLDCLCGTTKKTIILHDTLEQLKKEMCDDIIRKKSNNIVHILMGDFNLITNGHIDRAPLQHIPRPKFFNDFETLGLIDSYRKLNKEELGNNHHKEDVSMRIDQI